jgi:hypothetical protein
MESSGAVSYLLLGGTHSKPDDGFNKSSCHVSLSGEDKLVKEEESVHEQTESWN